jgi:hypothetical protein
MTDCFGCGSDGLVHISGGQRSCRAYQTDERACTRRSQNWVKRLSDELQRFSMFAEIAEAMRSFAG